MTLGREDFKVDQTCIPLDQDWRILFITNINVPIRYLSDPSTLDRINTFILSEYNNISQTFIQFSATYSLENINTGAQREWVGNFFPISNTRYSITPFFESGDFLTKARECLKEDYILKSLTLPDEEETDWVFEEVHSAIINCQARTTIDHTTVQRRGLEIRRHGRAGRNHITYLFQ